MFNFYISNPVRIEAVQFTNENKDRVFNLLTGQISADMESGNPVLKVTTIHGEIAIVRIGDWIVKESVEGFYYPIKDDVFRKRYWKPNG